jgi:hypothetical protein
MSMAKPAAAESTVEKQRPAHLFKPGQSGNPAGRPKGARNAFSQDFIHDVHKAWQEHGAAALKMTALTEPGRFLQVCASLMPKDVSVDIDVTIRAQNALDAFRIVKSLPRDELLQLRQIDADTE